MDEDAVKLKYQRAELRRGKMMEDYRIRGCVPSKNDPNYYSARNIYHASGYGMPNCTCYAYGRLLENGVIYRKLTGNAGRWYQQAITAGYPTGTEPKLGAVIVFERHVAIVEHIYDNGDILTSNSQWKGELFFMRKITKESGYKYGKQKFLGFIYLK